MPENPVLLTPRFHRVVCATLLNYSYRERLALQFVFVEAGARLPSNQRCSNKLDLVC